MATKRIDLDTGSTDFGFVDQKGRACGYCWLIQQVTSDQPTVWRELNAERTDFVETVLFEANVPYVELYSTPSRNGRSYGPSNRRVLVATLEEARQVAVKRAEASRKRDTKKFAEFNKEPA